MSTDEILIIGTDPPCPRCDYLKQMVVDIVNDLQLSVPVRHVGYTSDEIEIAERLLQENPPDAVKKRLQHVLDLAAPEDAVDLSDWSLSGGIRFAFPDDATIGPGGYLLVANDAEALAAKHPAIADRPAVRI